MATSEELLARFGTSEHGNYTITDTIGVPHPYCITPKHIEWAADHFSGLLSKDAIRDAEKKHGARCDICRGKLTFDQHEQALLVTCKAKLSGDDGKATPELHAYLLACKDKLTSDKEFAGFAFVEAK